MAKDNKPKAANANVVTAPPSGVIEPGSAEAAAARAGTPEAVEPAAAPVAPPVLMVTSKRPPTLEQLNAKHHETFNSVEAAKSQAMEAAKRAIEAAFATTKKA